VIVAVNVLDSHALLDTAGPLAVLLVLFVETGLLVGFFLPGDSLLFTAGVLCATEAGTEGHLPLLPTLVCAVAGALVGAQTGYVLGVRGGRPLLRRGSPRLQAAADRAEQVLERYGLPKALVLSRFVPVVRTVINPLAGIIGVPPRTFLVWQSLGGLLWSVGVTLAGYGLGSSISNVDHYLLPIVAVVLVVSVAPVAVELWRGRRRSRETESDPS
jgi:membrane-associated protein